MYFAQLDSDNIVLKVIVADQEFVDALNGTWIETDINGISPKNYAGIGYKYRQDLNMFIPSQPFASWTLDEINGKWNAPVAYPNDGSDYRWDESTIAWVLVS